MTDLQQRIAALREAVGKMTEAPWHLERDVSHFDSMTHIASSTGLGAGLIHADAAMESDAAGIVALRNNALAIIDDQQREIERLRARAAELENPEWLRVVAVEAIRAVTDCPDIKGNNGEYLSEAILRVAKGARRKDMAHAVDAGPTPLRGRDLKGRDRI